MSKTTSLGSGKVYAFPSPRRISEFRSVGDLVFSAMRNLAAYSFETVPHFSFEVDCEDWFLRAPTNGSFCRSYHLVVRISGETINAGAPIPISCVSDLRYSQILRFVKSLTIRCKLDGFEVTFSSTFGEHCDRISREVNAILPRHGLQGRGDGK